jgi:hypothetical protein
MSVCEAAKVLTRTVEPRATDDDDDYDYDIMF